MIFIKKFKNGNTTIRILNPTSKETALLRKAESLANLYNESWNEYEGTNLYRNKEGGSNEEKEKT